MYAFTIVAGFCSVSHVEDTAVASVLQGQTGIAVLCLTWDCTKPHSPAVADAMTQQLRCAQGRNSALAGLEQGVRQRDCVLPAAAVGLCTISSGRHVCLT